MKPEREFQTQLRATPGSALHKSFSSACVRRNNKLLCAADYYRNRPVGRMIVLAAKSSFRPPRRASALLTPVSGAEGFDETRASNESSAESTLHCG